MATSSQADAQPLTTAGETQQAPGVSSQPVTRSDDAAKITEMVNDPRQVGSVRKAVKFLAGMRNSLAKLRKMRADRHLDNKEHDSNDTGKVGCCKVGFGFSKGQASRGNGKVKAKITSFAKSIRTLYGKKVASAHKFFSGGTFHGPKPARDQVEHDVKDGGGNENVRIASESAVAADQSVGIGIEDDTVSEDMVMITLPQIVITPTDGPDMPVQVVSPVSPSSRDLDDKPVDPVAPSS